MFRYKKPVLGDQKVSISLAKTEWGSCGIQILNRGGENNLHVHAHGDGFWFVLTGRLRFYTTGDEVVAEIGENEGVLMPRGYPYWFETVETPNGDDTQVIRFGASDEPMTPGYAGRTNLEDLKSNQDPNLRNQDPNLRDD